MTDSTKITPPPPRPHPVTPKPGMPPAERASIDAQRQAHMRATVPQHAPTNSSSDPLTMSDQQLRDHVLAKHRQMIAHMPRAVLLDALAVATQVVAEMKAEAELPPVENDADADAPAETQPEGLEAVDRDPTTGLTEDELAARYGAQGPAAKAAMAQQAEKLAAKAAEAAAAADVAAQDPDAAQDGAAGPGVDAGMAALEAAGEVDPLAPAPGDDETVTRDDNALLDDVDLNASLEALGVDFDPAASPEDRMQLLHDARDAKAKRDADGDGHDDKSGQFTGETAPSGLEKHRQLKEAIKALGGTPKGNTAALEAQLAYLQENPPAPAGGEA